MYYSLVLRNSGSFSKPYKHQHYQPYFLATLDFYTSFNPINPFNRKFLDSSFENLNILSNPINHIYPINPLNPICPINQINPINPIKPINPTNPINPFNPINPINLVFCIGALKF